MATITTLALLSAGFAVAQMSMPNMTGITPPIVECSTLTFDLEDGTPPYNITVMQDGSNEILFNWLNLQAGCYSWAVAVAAKVSVMFMITDVTGMMTTALPYTEVEPGSDSCLAAASSSSAPSGMSSMSSMSSMSGMSSMARMAKRQSSGSAPTAIQCPSMDMGGGHDSTPVGAIAGGTVAGVVVIGLAAAALFFARRRRQRLSRTQDGTKASKSVEAGFLPPSTPSKEPLSSPSWRGTTPYHERTESLADTTTSGGHWSVPPHSADSTGAFVTESGARTNSMQPTTPSTTSPARSSFAPGQMMAQVPTVMPASYYRHGIPAGGYSGAAEPQNGSGLDQPDQYPSFRGSTQTTPPNSARSSGMRGPRPFSGNKKEGDPTSHSGRVASVPPPYGA